MPLLELLLIGLIAGWVADRVMRGHHNLAGEMAVGVIGSFVGNFTFGLIGLASYGLVGALTTAMVGSMLFLVILRHL